MRRMALCVVLMNLGCGEPGMPSLQCACLAWHKVVVPYGILCYMVSAAQVSISSAM